MHDLLGSAFTESAAFLHTNIDINAGAPSWFVSVFLMLTQRAVECKCSRNLNLSEEDGEQSTPLSLFFHPDTTQDTNQYISTC